MNGWRQIVLLALLFAPWTLAGPLAPGDTRLRHDVALLSDAGVLLAPFSGWPISRGDLALLDEITDLPEHLDAARARVLAALGADLRMTAGFGGASRDNVLRGFGTTPREDAEAQVGLDWHTGRFDVNVRMARVHDPADGREWRADGSQAGVRLGNWWLGASATDRWWGPGWDGSLILSSNARPVPALVLQRHRALAFQSRWLRFIGPWTTQVIWGQLEGERDHANARLFGLRVGARPHKRFEVGLSRTAQWCGSGRPCDATTFGDLLSGVRDNRGQNVSIEDEPGNQLAGFDLRFTFDALGRPWAFYAQRIGEDERGGLPSANLTMVGFSTWGGDAAGNGHRAHLEYANSECGGFTGGDPIFGCAYNHSIYTDGYRYRDRSIGHTQDGDGRVLSAALVLVRANDVTWRAGIRSGELNRGSHPGNAVAALRTDIVDVELAYSRDTALGVVKVGMGAEQRDAVGQSATWYGRAFLSFEHFLRQK